VVADIASVHAKLKDRNSLPLFEGTLKAQFQESGAVMARKKIIRARRCQKNINSFLSDSNLIA
jgi:hypothetical protein